MLQKRGEAVEVHRLVVPLLRGGDQASRGVGIEVETLLQQQGHGATLVVGKHAIGLRDMDEKRRGGEAQVILPELPLRGIGASHVLQELPQSFKHAPPNEIG